MPVEIEKKVVLKNKEKDVSLCVDRPAPFHKSDGGDMRVEVHEKSSGYGMNEDNSKLVWFRVTREDLLRFVDEIKKLIEESPELVEVVDSS